MRALAAGLALAAFLAISCGGAQPVPVDGEPDSAGVQVLRLRWVKRLTPTVPNFLIPEMVEEHDRFNPLETAGAGFDTDRQRVFIGSSLGGLYCFDVRDGETVWRLDLDDAVGSVPLYEPQRRLVFVGADDGRLYAVHARSGRLVWSIETSAEVRRAPLMHDGTLYVRNASGMVFAINPDDGEIIWQHRRQAVEGFASSGHAGLVLHRGMILTAFSDGVVEALDATGGTVVWAQDLASEVAPEAGGAVQLIDADATPAVVGDTVVAASVAGGVRGLALETGAVRWTRPDVTGVTGLAADTHAVYAARSGHGLMALDPEDGSTLWSRRFATGVMQDPVLHDDVLLVADSEYGLFVASSANGDLLQRVDQNEGFFARPAVYAGYMLILGNDGVLYAMSIL